MAGRTMFLYPLMKLLGRVFLNDYVAPGLLPPSNFPWVRSIWSLLCFPLVQLQSISLRRRIVMTKRSTMKRGMKKERIAVMRSKTVLTQFDSIVFCWLFNSCGYQMETPATTYSSIFPKTVPEDPIYLDYNATTPVDPEVAKAMWPYMTQYFGNPSSSHVYGKCTYGVIC